MGIVALSIILIPAGSTARVDGAGLIQASIATATAIAPGTRLAAPAANEDFLYHNVDYKGGLWRKGSRVIMV
jgi:hypothetical protein